MATPLFFCIFAVTNEQEHQHGDAEASSVQKAMAGKATVMTNR